MIKNLHGFKAIWKYRLSDDSLRSLYIVNQYLLDVDIPKSFAHKRTFRAVKQYVVENTAYTRETRYNPERAEYFDDAKCCDIIYNDYVAILAFRFMPGTLFLRQSEWAEKTCPDHGWWVGQLIGYMKDNEGVIGKFCNGFIRITGLKPHHYFPLIMAMLEDVDVRKRRYPPLKELPSRKEKQGYYYPVLQTPPMKWSIKMLEASRRTLEESLEGAFNVNADTVIPKLREKKYALQKELSNALSGLNGVDDFIRVCKKVRLWERAVTQLWAPKRRTANELHLNKIRWYWFIDDQSSFKLVYLREQNPELFTFLMNETAIFNDITEEMRKNLKNWENSSAALKAIRRKQEQNKRDALVSNPKYAWGESEIMYPADRELRYAIKEALSFDNAYDSYDFPYPYDKDMFY